MAAKRIVIHNSRNPDSFNYAPGTRCTASMVTSSALGAISIKENKREIRLAKEGFQKEQ
jgi:hypothetical protein